MHRSGWGLRSAFVCVLGLLAMPASADAAQRWASPGSTVASGPCSVTSPCDIEHAIEGATAGDQVVVAPGAYQLAGSLDPTVPIDLHGVAGQPRPHLIGTGTTTLLSFKSGGSVRHLALEATGSLQDALTLRGGLGEDLLLRSATGDGGKVNGMPEGTVLRDSIVQAFGSGEGLAGLKVRDSGAGGDVTLVNITIMATGAEARGIRCELENGQARLVNTIVRGVVADIDASSGNDSCTARSSNFRPQLSPGVIAGTGNQQTSPLFVDAAGGDLRTRADSPTVNAGSADLLLGLSDLAGCSRLLGGAPDIGAYEYADPSLDGCAWAPPEHRQRRCRSGDSRRPAAGPRQYRRRQPRPWQCARPAAGEPALPDARRSGTPARRVDRRRPRRARRAGLERRDGRPPSVGELLGLEVRGSPIPRRPRNDLADPARR